MRIFKQELNQQLLEAEHKVASAVAELNVIKAAKDGTEAKFQQQLELNRYIQMYAVTFTSDRPFITGWPKKPR